MTSPTPSADGPALANGNAGPTAPAAPPTVAELIAESRKRGAAGWSDMGPRVWFLAANPARSDHHYRINPAVAMCAVRKACDVVLLPGGHDSTREFADFCREVYGLKEEQIRYTEDTGAFMVESNHAGAVDQLKKLIDLPPADGQRLTLLPSKISAAMNKWLPQLQSTGLLVLGDTSLTYRNASAALLHRTINDLEQSSSREEVSPEIVVPRGYVCTVSAELLQALAKLREELGEGKHEMLLRPLKVAGGGTLLTITTEQELRMYDFPHGPVVLEEKLRSDVTRMGLPYVLTIPFLGRRLMQPLEVTRQSNGSIAGIHSSTAPSPLVTQAESWAWTLLSSTRLAAAGAGIFEFVVIKGQLVLINAGSGFYLEHFPALFLERYGSSKSKLLCWLQTPADNLDVWTFWYRLYDNNVIFRPGSKRSVNGVFPLLFNKTESSLFMAIAESEEELQPLVHKADALAREPPTEKPLDRVGLDDSVRRIWCGSARPEYRRETQRYNLPNRCIPLLRKDLDYIILPGNHSLTRQYWEFVRDVKGLREEQALFTSNEHFVMDDDVGDEIISRIRGLVSSHPKDKFTLVPYCVTANFERWSAQLKELGVTVFGENFAWVNKYGHKGILHRHVAHLDTPAIMEEIAPNVRVAKGYGCSNVEHLLEAHKLLGGIKVVIKPIYGAAGEGIIFVDDAETLRSYTFPMGAVVLEEFLDLDRTADGIVLSPAVHYLGPTLLGSETNLVDQIMVSTSYAGWRRSQATKLFQETCTHAVKKILKAIQPQGPGGFDFLSVEGVPFLTDINTGRFNGAHFPKLFHQMYAPEATMYCFKFKPPANLPISQFWQRLVSAELSFVPAVSQGGVFPLVYLRGLSGLYIVLAASEQECLSIADQTKQLLVVRSNLAQAPPAPLKPYSSQVRLTLLQNPAAVYGPQPMDCAGVLLGGRHIVGLLGPQETASMALLLPSIGGTVINASRLIVTPGFVDPHVHITGGGGERGPASRVPELTISQIVNGGITTVVGVLGTDSVSRSLENLLTKARALEVEGITSFVWSGAYRVPTPTLTGNGTREIVLIEKCLGLGEIAVADHRGSQPTVHELEVMAAECHVGGMLAGKAGILHVHVGRDINRVKDLFAAIKDSNLPITCIYPTHMSRSPELSDAAVDWIKLGGYVDLTAGSGSTLKTLNRFHADGVDLGHVTISTDAGGSCPSFDPQGNLIMYKALGPSGLMEVFKRMTLDMQWPLERTLPLMTLNTAKVLKLDNKGRIELGADADVLLLDVETFELRYVFGRGQMLKGPGYLRRGMFEQDSGFF